MTALRVWLARVTGLFGRRSRDEALAAELQAHLDEMTDELVERGMSPAQAAAAARRTFGGVDRIKEAYRDQRGWPSLELLAHDVRLALRLLAARPGSAALAVVGLALGIGVSMALVTIVNAHCLRGLPIDSPDRVLFVTTRDREARPGGMSYADFRDLQRHASSFAGVAAYAQASINAADDRDAPERIAGSYISADTFRLLAVSPTIGRDFDPADEAPGAPNVAILGHAVWASRYDGDPAAIGRTVRLDGRPTTIIGVMPAGFRFPGQANVWLPLRQMPGLDAQPRSARGLAVLGRLTAAATPAGARDELHALAARLEAEYPSTNRGLHFWSVPINEQFNGRITDPVWLAFLTAGVLVLLVACANVANVLLARLGARSRDVALRLAMGGTRARIVRQLVIESVVLAGLAGTLGLGFAIGAVRLLAWSVPSAAPLPYWLTYTVDGRVLGALLTICTASVIIVGLVPAVVSSRLNVNELLKDGGRHSTGRTRRWSAIFLAAEFALTFVLLTNVTMEWRREFRSNSAGVPIDQAPLLTARMTLPPTSYGTPDERREFYARLDETVGRIGGVVSMTTTSQLPPDGGQPRRLLLAGQALGPGEEGPVIFAASVGPRYFGTLGADMVAGRDLTEDDSTPGHEGVVINQQLAERFFGNSGAVGQRLTIVDPEAASSAPLWRTIVGIAPNLRHGAVPVPVAYVSDREAPPSSTILIVRTATSPDAVAAAIRDTVATLDQDLPLYRVVPLAQAAHEGNWNGRVSAAILHSITIVAMLLAVVGLYAVTAHAVVQRKHEIGIRVALGATASVVTWLVLRRALTDVGFGLAAGLGATVLFERLFTDISTGHALTNPPNLALAAGLVLIVSVAACVRPATRAARIAPATALRSD